ncbi:MBL fold metallo-hydrolase [Yinghuangia sp. YIM S09857]|uniref:MBL fold metallo-hydrolase n=1 Tax=Yinghuangia sp. YIM S09857 TaxID=3436929 RepID=UPI003F53099B
MSNDTIAITRVANSCVLLEIGGLTVLTDPFFTERWHVRRGEPLGLTVGQLPSLTAIVASHSYPNHWDLRGLRGYHDKTGPMVCTSSARMARRAGRAGYSRARYLPWGETVRPVPTLSVRAVAAGRNLGQRQNAYVIESGGVRVFFGGEIRDVAHLARHRKHEPAVHVALLPVNGLRPLVGPPVVMGPAEAVAGATALGDPLVERGCQGPVPAVVVLAWRLVQADKDGDQRSARQVGGDHALAFGGDLWGCRKCGWGPAMAIRNSQVSRWHRTVAEEIRAARSRRFLCFPATGQPRRPRQPRQHRPRRPRRRHRRHRSGGHRHRTSRLTGTVRTRRRVFGRASRSRGERAAGSNHRPTIPMVVTITVTTLAAIAVFGAAPTMLAYAGRSTSSR